MDSINILAKRRWYVYVLLVALLWFQVFLMFSSREDMKIGVLRTGGVSVIKTLGRTSSELVVSVRGERSRAHPLLLFLLVGAFRLAYDRIFTKPHSAEYRRAYGMWEILIGKELASLPHSDMVLRI